MVNKGGRESYEVSEEYELYWWMVSRAEEEYFKHIEKSLPTSTHKSDILMLNDFSSTGLPF